MTTDVRFYSLLVTTHLITAVH